jgi:hypothetical protein
LKAVSAPLSLLRKAACIAATTAYAESIARWTDGTAPESSDFKATLATLLSTILARVTEIETRQGDNTYAKAKAKIDVLLEIKDQESARLRTLNQLTQLLTALSEQASRFQQS